MITSALLSIVLVIIGAIITVFPTSTGFSLEVTNAFVYVGGYLKMLSPILPIDTMATAVTIAISVELILYSFKAITWVFGKIPVLGK